MNKESPLNFSSDGQFCQTLECQNDPIKCCVVKKDPDTRERFYDVDVNETLIKRKCPYKDRDYLLCLIAKKDQR